MSLGWSPLAYLSSFHLPYVFYTHEFKFLKDDEQGPLGFL